MPHPLREPYPLMESCRDTLRAVSGRPLSEVTLERVAAGELSPADLHITADTLRRQSEIAAAAGYLPLACNLRRAAELTAIPDEQLLAMYEMLRPGRASYAELLALAARLETEYAAPESAALVREAAEVYQARGLLRAE
jgi:propanediol dehydratase small subunit